MARAFLATRLVSMDARYGKGEMMVRISRIMGVTAFFTLVFPRVALAADGVAETISWIRIVISLVGLAVAVVLLLEALGVRKLALGGAIGDKISYVILAIICLAASALAQWTGNFVGGLTYVQTELASQVLVIVAMALLAVYFFNVRRAMQRYLKAMTGAEHLSAESADESAMDLSDRPEVG